MATRQSTIDFLIDQLSSLPSIRSRKMFGEYALYCDEKVVALVCDDQLFVKITSEGKAFVGKSYQEGYAYPGAKASILIGADDLEDHERLCELIRVTADALPPVRPRKPKTSTPKATVSATRTKAKRKTRATRLEAKLDHSTPGSASDRARSTAAQSARKKARAGASASSTKKVSKPKAR